VHDAHLMLALAEGFGQSPVAALLLPDLDPVAVLADPPSPPTVPPRVAARLRDPGLAAAAASLRQRCEADGISVLTPADHHWPTRLDQMQLRPLAVFVRGCLHALVASPAVAIVGSRSPTPYGIDAGQRLAKALVRAGAVLWSGLARGVDAIAHKAAVAASRPTVAVLAGGLDWIYPPEHRKLADRIVDADGCLVSELPPGQRARRGHFVRRNRLIAAGAEAVVVVEASLASGALHTARFAAEGHTDLHAVPGPFASERSQGCHRLIAEGAMIVEGPESLLSALGLGAGASGASSLRLERSAEQERLLQLLAGGPRPTDLLLRESRLERSTFLRSLFDLEGQGLVARLPGDLWRRADAVPNVTSR
jgi:DNA processing protein